ncbi:CarD family transcriptional regulator [Clostridium nigeriense]|uniref:CarD family transcriptional regulator n=1 Tax=Clostridium nigeriense TaxID=1805470 RepID=UPI003D3260A6
MFKKGDLVLYSAHGVCKIDDICEKTISYVTKSYYILHPMEDNKLSISIPVDNDKVSILELLTKEEAGIILESFKDDGAEWINIDKDRSEKYNEVIKQGNRTEIAKIVNTLMKEKNSLENNGKKFHEKDKKMLLGVQNTLFSELAFLLDTTRDEIEKKVSGYVNI